MSPKLSTAEDRRGAVLAAAVSVFGQRGYYGSTTAEVAAAAGISQPYIYRLFTDKQSLFVAVIEHVSEHMLAALAAGAARAAASDPDAVLSAMSEAYATLIADRGFVMLLMQANCAAGEPQIKEALRECYAKQVEYVRAVSGASDDKIRGLFAHSLLANVMQAIDSRQVDAPWARTLDGRT